MAEEAQLCIFVHVHVPLLKLWGLYNRLQIIDARLIDFLLNFLYQNKAPPRPTA